jgi:hypothetical protein
MPEHKDIPDIGLHEPKGAVSALAGQQYISNGAGSGSWTIPEPKGASTALVGQQYYSDGAGSGQWLYPPEGWGVYADNEAATQMFNTTPAPISINSLGAVTDERYLPREMRGVSSFWNTAINRIISPQLGDSFDVRVDFSVISTTASPTYILFQLDMGAPGSPIIIAEEEISFDRTATPFAFSVSFPVFAAETFMANGAQLLLSTNTGTASLGPRRVFVGRSFSERP